MAVSFLVARSKSCALRHQSLAGGVADRAVSNVCDMVSNALLPDTTTNIEPSSVIEIT